MKLLVIEDEFRTRNAIISIVERNCKEITIEGWADNVNEAIQLIKAKKPDLVLMDIQLTDGNAFDILKSFDDIDFGIIFLTAYENYALQAIKFSAFDYLLKPFTEEDLTETITRFKKKNQKGSLDVLLNNINSGGEKKIILKTNEDIYIVSIKDIIRCEADSSYTHFFLNDGTHITVSGTLKKYEDYLKHFNFIRVHHSHIVSLNFITKFSKLQGGSLELKNGDIIPVSKRKKDDMLKLFNSL
jgi:two-component system LytT family response regulator